MKADKPSQHREFEEDRRRSDGELLRARSKEDVVVAYDLPGLLAVLREEQPDANEREAWLVDALMRAFPYIPVYLYSPESKKSVREEINDWLSEAYGQYIAARRVKRART